MTIRDFIELLKKYPKYYKLFDVSAENGMIQIRDEKGKYVTTLTLDEILPEREEWFSNAVMLSLNVAASGSLNQSGFLTFARAVYNAMTNNKRAMISSTFGGTFSIGVAYKTSNKWLVGSFFPSDYATIYKYFYNYDTDTVAVKKLICNLFN